GTELPARRHRHPRCLRRQPRRSPLRDVCRRPRAPQGPHVLLRAWGEGGPWPADLVLALTGTAEPDLPPGVTVLHLSRAQVMTAWRRAAVAVVPSQWADPCPTVVMEAMSAGTP